MRLAGKLAALIAAAGALIAVAGATGSENGLAVAVLGDSDSHSYRDRVSGVRRGGVFHDSTFNWLEVWARLRPGEIDPGSFAAAGERRSVARLKALASIATRAPHKEDYLYNFAWSGAGCASLRSDWPEQARWLLARLKAEPARWRHGLVVIRIGVNDFGQPEHLARWAIAPAEGARVIDGCLAEIAGVAHAIRRASSVHVAFVGIAHDYDTPFADEPIVAAADVEKVAAVLDRFDEGLAAIAAADPRMAFVDDRAWFAARYGGRRTRDSRPAAMVGGIAVANAVGDEPANLHLADGHAGTIASGLFLQHLVSALNAKFGLDLEPIRDEEIVSLVRD